MAVLGIIIGIIVTAVLAVHVFLTNNVIEKNCADLLKEVNDYYSKNIEEE